MTLDLSPPSRRHVKTSGTRHAFVALGYSFDGFRRLMQETAFRHEFFAALGIFCSFALAGAAAVDYVVEAGLVLMLFALEAFNTSIELIVDRVSPEFSRFAKQTKDLGSFAVFCLLLTNAMFALFVLCSAL